MKNNTNRVYTPAERAGMWLKAEIKRYATENSMTLSKSYVVFADRLYCEPRTVQRYCSNGINSLNTVFEVATSLGVGLGDVFSAQDEDVPFLLLYFTTTCELILCQMMVYSD